MEIYVYTYESETPLSRLMRVAGVPSPYRRNA
jgi:hypothetical protein